MGKARDLQLPVGRVFLAVDDSRSSWRGVEVTLALARSMGSRVTVVHVVPPGQAGGSIPTEEEKSAESVVSGVRNALARDGVKARTELVRYGDPRAAVVQLARRGWCDLLVIGSSCDEGWDAYSVGETAMGIAVDFPGPVLLVKKRSGFSVVTLLVEEGGELGDVDLAIGLAGSLGGRMNFLVAGSGESRDGTLRWAMQRACDAGVTPAGAVVEGDPGSICRTAGRQGTTTMVVRRRRGLLSRIRGGDPAMEIACDCTCSVLLL